MAQTKIDMCLQIIYRHSGNLWKNYISPRHKKARGQAKRFLERYEENQKHENIEEEILNYFEKIKNQEYHNYPNNILLNAGIDNMWVSMKKRSITKKGWEILYPAYRTSKTGSSELKQLLEEFGSNFVISSTADLGRFINGV